MVASKIGWFKIAWWSTIFIANGSSIFTFVENNVEANILACTAKYAPGKVFNIACGESYTLNQLVNFINNILGKKIEPIFTNVRLGDVFHSLADINKAKEILDYNVLLRFNSGLEKMINSLCKN